MRYFAPDKRCPFRPLPLECSEDGGTSETLPLILRIPLTPSDRVDPFDFCWLLYSARPRFVLLALTRGVRPNGLLLTFYKWRKSELN